MIDKANRFAIILGFLLILELPLVIFRKIFSQLWVITVIFVKGDSAQNVYIIY